jgi:hypothetical protein
MIARGAVPGLGFLALDDRLRRAARSAQLPVLPTPTDWVSEPVG